MTATASRFLRRTTLHGDEYRTNFRQIDCEVIATLTSDEAGRITSQMSKVYLRLVNAPAQYWEREGVIRFAGGEKEGKCMTAWEQLISLTGVASATARKALRWMNEQAIIGYFAGRNGVGIRIFINRAASSIGHKARTGQKNLRLVQASSHASHTSRNDMPFNDSFAVLDKLDTDINPGAPKNGADTEPPVKSPSEPKSPELNHHPSAERREEHRETSGSKEIDLAVITLENVITRLRTELEPAIHIAARQAATREHERTRDWLENRGLPKAARVAQREAYNVLRQWGIIRSAKQQTGTDLNVGREAYPLQTAKPLSPEEIKELAETCITMLQAHGQSIDMTLSEISIEAGGFLLPEDAPKVHELANSMACEIKQPEQGG